MYDQGKPAEQGRDPITHDYPGLGLPLRLNELQEVSSYPIGAHKSNYGSECDLISVRELAMMDIMDKLSDKLEWHKKVFDDVIVKKWKKEELAISDEQFIKLADDHPLDVVPEGVLNERSFDYVSCYGN